MDTVSLQYEKVDQLTKNNPVTCHSMDKADILESHKSNTLNKSRSQLLTTELQLLDHPVAELRTFTAWERIYTI